MMSVIPSLVRKISTLSEPFDEDFDEAGIKSTTLKGVP